MSKSGQEKTAKKLTNVTKKSAKSTKATTKSPSKKGTRKTDAKIIAPNCAANTPKTQTKVAVQKEKLIKKKPLGTKQVEQPSKIKQQLSTSNTKLEKSEKNQRPIHAIKEAIPMSKSAEKTPVQDKVSTDNQVFEELRDILMQRRFSILRKLDDLDEAVEQGEDGKTGIVGDMADVAQDAAKNEMAFQLAEADSRELGQIEAALSKIADGTYGTCEICNGQIAIARLKALPFASNCIRCQEEEDNEKKNGYSW